MTHLKIVFFVVHIPLQQPVFTSQQRPLYRPQPQPPILFPQQQQAYPPATTPASIYDPLPTSLPCLPNPADVPLLSDSFGDYESNFGSFLSPDL